MKEPFSRRNIHLWTCVYCGAELLNGACVWCGGNAARAGRLAIQLGTRRRYLGVVLDVPSRLVYSAMTRFHALLDDRVIPGRAHVGTYAHLDSGYWLDAPDLLPAGGCRSVAYGPDDDYIPEQIIAFRVSPSEPG